MDFWSKEIKEIKTWHPDPAADTPFALLGSLEREIKHEGSDVVLGITSPKYQFGSRPGVSCCDLNYILVQYLNLKRNLRFVIQHEICHLFGAADLREKNSIMAGETLGYEFDEFTSKILLLNRNRPFSPGSPLFAAETRAQAISLYKERGDLNLGEDRLHAMLALLYYENGDYGAAEEQCTKALALDPGCLAATELEGHIHLARGKIDSAIAEFENVLNVKGESFAIPHFNLAVALAENGQIDEAIAEFREAIDISPDYYEANANLASLYIKKGEIDPSIAACRAALGQNADLPKAQYLLALGLILKWEAFPSPRDDAAAGLLEEAISLCQKALALSPDMAVAHNLVGVAYQYGGKSDLAEAEFQKALEMNPQLSSAHLNLGVLYFQNKNYAKAAHCLSQVLEIDPTTGTGLEVLDLVFKNMKRYDLLSPKKRQIPPLHSAERQSVQPAPEG
jgi:tetratricopeptide (TPR) repeat protein